VNFSTKLNTTELENMRDTSIHNSRESSGATTYSFVIYIFF